MPRHDIEEKAPEGKFRAIGYLTLDEIEEWLICEGDYNTKEAAIAAAKKAIDFEGTDEEWQKTAVVYNDKGKVIFSDTSRIKKNK